VYKRLLYDKQQEMYRLYEPTMHPYCSSVVTERVTYEDTVENWTAQEKARLNLEILSQVEGDFTNPYIEDETFMVFSLDEKGLVRQIPTRSGWISGNVGGAYDVHAGLHTKPDGTRDVEILNPQRTQPNDIVAEVIGFMRALFVPNGFVLV
jgi:hypothetical protein